MTPEKPFEEKTDTLVDPVKSTLADLMMSISEKLTVTNNTVDTSTAKANTCVKAYNNNASVIADNNILSEKDRKNSATPQPAIKSILRNASRTPSKNVLQEDTRNQEKIKRDKTPERCGYTVKFEPAEDQVIRVETQVVTLKYLIKELFKSLGDQR